MALGDSYTIGTSLALDERWPNQLVAALGADQLQLVANLGVDGYTSRDVIERELPVLAGLDAALVSLQVGVNDVIQGVPPDAYAANLDHLLDALLADRPPGGLICVATPDYTVTPQGSDYGEPGERRAGIVRANGLMAAACRRRRVAFVPEVFAISRRAATELHLVAADGLHPSGAQYALWVEAIRPVVERLLGIGPASIGPR